METLRSFFFVLSVLSVFVALMASSEAHFFYVGGRDGWVLNPSESYSHWAERNRFQVNDSLVFKYKKGEDSVLVVREQEDFDRCNVSNPVERRYTGSSVLTFDRSGPFFFISGVQDKCLKGQKLVTVVLAVRNKSPVSPPTPSPVSPVSPPAASPVSPVSPPTASPVSPPTASPVSPPTASPVSPPTASPVSPPTASPVSPPTASPSPSPVSPPTASPVSPPTASPSPVSPVSPPTASPVSPSPVSPPTASPVSPPAPSSLSPPPTSTISAPSPGPSPASSSSVSIAPEIGFGLLVAVLGGGFFL